MNARGLFAQMVVVLAAVSMGDQAFAKKVASVGVIAGLQIGSGSSDNLIIQSSQSVSSVNSGIGYVVGAGFYLDDDSSKFTFEIDLLYVNRKIGYEFPISSDANAETIAGTMS